MGIYLKILCSGRFHERLTHGGNWQKSQINEFACLADGAKNVSRPWLSLLQRWDRLIQWHLLVNIHIYKYAKYI